MAKDRLFIRCKGCRTVSMFSKYYPDGDLEIWNGPKLVAFMTEHLRDCQDWWGMELPPGGGFEFGKEADFIGFDVHSLGGPAD